MDEDQVIAELKARGSTLSSAIPCDRAQGLFFRLPEEFRHIGLTREEDGVGISAGAFLAGARPLIALQSSGLGNMLNAILSLTTTFGLPLPILASWRGGRARRSRHRSRSTAPSPGSSLPQGSPSPSSPTGTGPGRSVMPSASAYKKQSPHVILSRPGASRRPAVPRVVQFPGAPAIRGLL